MFYISLYLICAITSVDAGIARKRRGYKNVAVAWFTLAGVQILAAIGYMTGVFPL